jgi:hypothetical protein
MPITTNVVSLNPAHALCHKVCQWLATGQWFSPGSPVSSTNKTDRHNITEILLKVTLTLTQKKEGGRHTYIFASNVLLKGKQFLLH